MGQGLIWIDYVILLIIGISALIGVLRGLVKEALSLLGWILAFWVALGFAGELAGLLENQISVPSLRKAVAFFALFAATLLVSAGVTYLVGMLVEKSGISGTDRMLGIVFGIARGAIIVGLLVLLGGLTALPRDPWWRQSMLLPHFQAMAVELRGLLPADIAEKFRF